MSSIFRNNLQQNPKEMKPRKCFFSNCNNMEEDNPNPDALTLNVYSQSESQKLKSVYCCPKHSKPSSVTLKIPPINQPQVRSIEKKFCRITADTQMNEICRLCLKSIDITTVDKSFAPIFGEKTVILKNKRAIVEPSKLITNFTDISITKLQHTLFPQQICKNCFRNLCAMDKFRQMCEQSHETLRQAILKNEDAEYEPYEFIEIEVVSDNEDDGNVDGEKEVYGIVEESEPVKDPQPIIPYLAPQRCPMCLEILESCEDLKYHRMARHKNTFIYKCYVKNCKKAFRNIERLQAHHESFHRSCMNDKLYECEICKKVFLTQKRFKYHFVRHDEPKYPCTVCSKSFYDRNSFFSHQLVHNGQRNYLCDVCSKAFQTPYALRVHKRIHTNEKPFICHLCAEAFAYKCLLNSHLAKYHPNEPIEKAVL